MSDTNIVLDKEAVESILSSFNTSIQDFHDTYIKGMEETLDSLYDANVSGDFKDELKKVADNVSAYLEAVKRYYEAQYIIVENIKNSLVSYDEQTSNTISGG